MCYKHCNWPHFINGNGLIEKTNGGADLIYKEWEHKIQSQNVIYCYIDVTGKWQIVAY